MSDYLWDVHSCHLTVDAARRGAFCPANKGIANRTDCFEMDEDTAFFPLIEAAAGLFPCLLITYCLLWHIEFFF